MNKSQRAILDQFLPSLNKVSIEEIEAIAIKYGVFTLEDDVRLLTNARRSELRTYLNSKRDVNGSPLYVRVKIALNGEVHSLYARTDQLEEEELNFLMAYHNRRASKAQEMHLFFRDIAIRKGYQPDLPFGVALRESSITKKRKRTA